MALATYHTSTEPSHTQTPGVWARGQNTHEANSSDVTLDLRPPTRLLSGAVGGPEGLDLSALTVTLQPFCKVPSPVGDAAREPISATLSCAGPRGRGVVLL